MGATKEEEGLLTHLEGQTGGRCSLSGAYQAGMHFLPSLLVQSLYHRGSPTLLNLPFLVITFILTQQRTSHSEATVYLLFRDKLKGTLTSLPDSQLLTYMSFSGQQSQRVLLKNSKKSANGIKTFHTIPLVRSHSSVVLQM